MAQLLPATVSVNAARALPPPPPAAPQQEATTLRKEGVKLSDAEMKKLAALAAERDGQIKRDTSDEEWRDLFGRAKRLFRDCGFPIDTSRVLTRVFAARSHKGSNIESVLARVLVRAQEKGYEAAVQELESLGIAAPRAP